MTTPEPIRVGILHSLTGTMAMSETPLKDAELMAIAEINAAGGVLGRPIEAIVEDGASNPETFAHRAQKLLRTDKVSTVFGCWTSPSRKLVLPVFEHHNGLLWYPVQYEGLEQSKNIFYTGLCLNQQIEPAVDWLLSQGRTRFYLVGSDNVFPRTANKMIRAHLKQGGGTVVGEEEYILFGNQDFDYTLGEIQRLKPDVVFSTINGDSNLGFYAQYKAAGIEPSEIPIMAVSIAEAEIQRIGPEYTQGHYAAWSYFQGVETSQNQTFLKNFQRIYGRDRVLGDPIQCGYLQVYLWAMAVEKAQSTAVDEVREAAYGITFDAPEGQVKIERNHHLLKTPRIGQSQPDGQFKIVHEHNQPANPQPWLGIDETDHPNAQLVVNMLGEVAQSIQYSCQLTQKSHALENTMADLMQVNQELQQTQSQLIEIAHREDLLKRRLSMQIRSSFKLDTILESAVQEVCDVLQVDQCTFLWYRSETETFEVNHVARANSIQPHPLADTLWNQPPVRTAILEQTLFHTENLWSMADLVISPKDYPTDATLACLATTITTNSDRLGILACEHYSTAHIWHESEIGLIQEVADQLAIAIEQADLYQQSRVSEALALDQARQLNQTLQELQKTQAQMVQSEKMSSLGQLVAGVAHEINNPVNFIYGNLSHADEYIHDLLELITLYQEQFPKSTPALEDRIDEIDLEFLKADLPKLLDSMHVGTERIREIVKSLRTFSRLDEAAVKAVNIHDGIDSTLMILHNRIKARSDRPEIMVTKDYSELPLVECNGGQMNQVFMNLLANAIDALEEYFEACQQRGDRDYRPTITIRTYVVDANHVNISFADNGPGIPETVKASLFDPFFTTKPIGQGTGLGLSISHQVVTEKHNGHLACHSNTNQGTEFVITLPVQHELIDRGDQSGEFQKTAAPQVTNVPETIHPLSHSC
ncbi:MAG: urea ABC transporter substrate-binding protein [Cyanobacteria bacterium J06635_15]